MRERLWDTGRVAAHAMMTCRGSRWCSGDVLLPSTVAWEWGVERESSEDVTRSEGRTARSATEGGEQVRQTISVHGISARRAAEHESSERVPRMRRRLLGGVWLLLLCSSHDRAVIHVELWSGTKKFGQSRSCGHAKGLGEIRWRQQGDQWIGAGRDHAVQPS
jgi:hypothetical protein